MSRSGRALRISGLAGIACTLGLIACGMYITEIKTASPAANIDMAPVEGSVGLRMENEVEVQFRIEATDGLDQYDVFHWTDTITNAFIHGMEGKATRLQKHRGHWIVDVVRADLRFVRAESATSQIAARAAVDYEIRLLNRELVELASESGEALSRSLVARGDTAQATTAAGEAAAVMFEEAVPKLFATARAKPAQP